MFVYNLYLYGGGNNYECKIFKNHIDVVSNYSTTDRSYYKHIIPTLINKWHNSIKQQHRGPAQGTELCAGDFPV